MNSVFAKRQLEKQGWTEGDGLGRQRDGMQEPIKVTLKMDKTGVGHDPGKEFTDHWWMRAFNDAAKKIKKSDEPPDIPKEESEESKRQAEMSEKKRNFYKGFIKASTLSGGCETKNPDHTSEDEKEEESNKTSIPSLDDIHKFCGGATGHKAARFGIKMKGKLSRIAAHDKEFEETSKVQPGISYLKKRKHDNSSNLATPESNASDDDEDTAERRTKKKRKKTKDDEQKDDKQNNAGSEFTEETDRKRKKKKKDSKIAEAVTDATETNNDEDEQIETSDVHQQQTERKKKKKKGRVDTNNVDDSYNDEQQKKKKGKKRKHDDCSPERTSGANATVNGTDLMDDSRVTGTTELDEDDVRVKSSDTEVSRKRKKKSKHCDKESAPVGDGSLEEHSGETNILQEDASQSQGAICKIKKKKKKKNKD